MFSRSALALVAAVVFLGAVAGNQAAEAAHLRVVNCGRLAARAELSCARSQLHVARSEVRWIVHRSRSLSAAAHVHSVGFWRWRERVALGWLHEARTRLLLVSSAPSVVPGIICHVFGPADCGEAQAIAWRESRDETWAANSFGYAGLFQLGVGERATYATIGYSSAYEQTVAAHNLFLARGWEPWTCCEG